MKDIAENKSFASRWSRRKQQVQREQDINELVLEEEAPKQSTEEERLEKLNALTDEDMPDVEALNEDSDYAGFMSINVSEELRKIALQKLFHGKSYNIRDGLDEYDGDYTSFEKLDPSIITADMKHLLEVEAEKLLVKDKQDKELTNEIVEIEENDELQNEIHPSDDNFDGSVEVVEKNSLDTENEDAV